MGLSETTKDRDEHPGLARVGASTIEYSTLPSDFYAEVTPTQVAAPSLLRLNRDLALELGLSVEYLTSSEGVSILSGNSTFEGIQSIAMAYAGHQFGNFVPRLGDGRAHVIGDARDRAGRPYSLQLKGSGPTPFSRRGDGRAAVGPILREYVLCEAMSALGIPTTRALAMVTTGEPVYRERTEPGAILTRVARDYVRVGTFQYFAARGETSSLKTLADHVLARLAAHGRFDPVESTNPYRALLERVIEDQAELIAHWMLVGFIHGVMNTDNMSILGETIDYGPCAFLDDYDPGKVFSSIDQHGRYAYQQQPAIGLWNLTRFAETLLPLLESNEEAAIESAKEALAGYGERFQRAYESGLIAKLGFESTGDRERKLASEFLEMLAHEHADYTLAFRRLSDLRRDEPSDDEAIRALFESPTAFEAWSAGWRNVLRNDGIEDHDRMPRMRARNPLFIPRNHRIQQAIDALIDHADEGPLDDLIAVTTHPFDDDPARTDLSDPPEPHEVVHATFCGT